MDIHAPTVDTTALAPAIAWLYLVTNTAGLFTYLPQIVAAWRCGDGARAISLLTWASWTVSHLAASLYGALVVHDPYFACVSAIDLACCAAMTAIVVRRRRQLRRRSRSHDRRLPDAASAARPASRLLRVA